MRVTQQDIARIANVSQATVSRVLAGDSRVENDKRDRVLSAMEQANYRPDVRAQSLRKRRTDLIGIVLRANEDGAKDDPFIAALVSEITTALTDTDFHLCLDIAKDARHQSSVYDELLRTRRIDGLLLVEPEMNDVRLQRLQRDRFPFVVIGNPRGTLLHSVDNDNVMAARMATVHLLDQGFHDIGFLAGPKNVAVSDDRITGYEMAIRERGLTPRIWHSAFGHEDAANVALQILSERKRPRALVVMDDFMATGVIKSANRANLQVPQDLAIVSFNDSVLCHLVPGGLTSVNMNLSVLVKQAIEKLIALIDRPGEVEPSRQVVPCELKVRGSALPHGATLQ
jgi:DNA-binding LacI/PurR family transcriptional regulator